MAVFAMPIILMIQADTTTEAQKALEEWEDNIDIHNDLPVGTNDIDISPSCELNDEGQRVLYLPAFEDIDEDEDDDVDDDDDSDDDTFDGDTFDLP